jgi:hypothetical protein
VAHIASHVCCVYISGRCVDDVACSAAAAVVADHCCCLDMVPIRRLHVCIPCLCSNWVSQLSHIVYESAVTFVYLACAAVGSRSCHILYMKQP